MGADWLRGSIAGHRRPLIECFSGVLFTNCLFISPSKGAHASVRALGTGLALAGYNCMCVKQAEATDREACNFNLRRRAAA